LITKEQQKNILRHHVKKKRQRRRCVCNAESNFELSIPSIKSTTLKVTVLTRLLNLSIDPVLLMPHASSIL
jgi:hypothetical protein